VEGVLKILIDMISKNFKLNGNIVILLLCIQDYWSGVNMSVDRLANFNISMDHLNVLVLDTLPSELQKLIFDDIFMASMSRTVSLVL